MFKLFTSNFAHSGVKLHELFKLSFQANSFYEFQNTLYPG